MQNLNKPIEEVIDKYLNQPEPDRIDDPEEPEPTTMLERVSRVCGVTFSNDFDELLIQSKINDIGYSDSLKRTDAIELIRELLDLMAVTPEELHA